MYVRERYIASVSSLRWSWNIVKRAIEFTSRRRNQPSCATSSCGSLELVVLILAILVERLVRPVVTLCRKTMFQHNRTIITMIPMRQKKETDILIQTKGTTASVPLVHSYAGLSLQPAGIDAT